MGIGTSLTVKEPQRLHGAGGSFGFLRRKTLIDFFSYLGTSRGSHAAGSRSHRCLWCVHSVACWWPPGWPVVPLAGVLVVRCFLPLPFFFPFSLSLFPPPFSPLPFPFPFPPFSSRPGNNVLQRSSGLWRMRWRTRLIMVTASARVMACRPEGVVLLAHIPAQGHAVPLPPWPSARQIGEGGAVAFSPVFLNRAQMAGISPG